MDGRVDPDLQDLSRSQGGQRREEQDESLDTHGDFIIGNSNGASQPGTNVLDFLLSIN
jgi:hypothetical protein